MSSDRGTAFDVFFSYSHRDEALRDELEVHLASLKREGSIRTWHDRRIGAGREWEGETDARLESAHLVLLLISPDFIASDYCFDVEMTRALDRHDAGETRVIPIILRPVDWETTRFAKLQALPKDGEPVTRWDDRDAAYLDAVRSIRGALEELRRQQAPPAPSTPAEPDTEPDYPDERTRELSQALGNAYELEEELLSQGQDTRAVSEEILRLRREIREGGQLKAGDFLLGGRFRLLEKIGRGGFAIVWKATDKKTRGHVAVKVLHGQYAQDRSRRERFFRGARKMAELQHQGVVRVIEEEREDGGYYFFVMEYVGGGDFRKAVLEGRLTLEERLQVALEVGEALSFAHGHGLVHRDVKPGNILLSGEGRPKLTDFDLVRAADTTGGTRTTMLGTFLYAAPEAMMDAKNAGVPADVYGLGMTVLFALHGADLPADVLWELPDLVMTLKVTERCRQAVSRAVARKVADRWATVEDFCGALRKSMETRDEATVVVEESGPVDVKPPHEVVEIPGPSEGERLIKKDESVLVHVPGGEYTLGEHPVHRVVLSPFWIGKYPVTNQQFRRFLKENPERQGPRFWADEKFNDPRQPVVGVSWMDALAYCRWAGLDLPSEAEWETAARGTDARRYPWGDEEPTRELANFGSQVGRPTPVGSYPKGAGPYGTLDQAGNTWEWCRDRFEGTAYEDRDGQRDPVVTGDDSDASVLRVVRGGSWARRSRLLPAAFRDGNWARYRDRYLGFRVVCRSGPEP